MKKTSDSNPSSAVDRRSFLTRAGLAVAGSTFLGSNLLSLSSFAEREGENSATSPLVDSLETVMKPVTLPKPGSLDPVEHSMVDNLFWSDIMMEHALFFVLLLPGNDLAALRAEAQRHQKQFAQHLAQMKRAGFSTQNFRAINARTIELVKPFLEFKLRALDLQLSGKIHSLVWPLFWSHTAREARRFIVRLEMYSRNSVVFDPAEVVDFWTSTMGEHAQFIAHMLDPQEVVLIQKANQTANVFLGSLKRSPRNFDALLQAGEQIIDFKTAAEKGIETGQIKSIIHPALADHVRREAVKYVDELKRS